MLCATRHATRAARCVHVLGTLKRDGDGLSRYAESSGWWPLLQE